MLTYTQALEIVLKNTPLLSSEDVFIEQAAGYVLAEDVYSKIDMPPFDKSAVDGYALTANDACNPPVKLRCIGLIQAGERFKGRAGAGQCVKIMTGAPMPRNTDSVVMVEDTARAGEFVELLKPVHPGQNVCRRGEDIQRGQKVLRKGKRIFLADIPLLAAVGRQDVKVIGKPRVAVLNTGGEIAPVGSRLGANEIYNSNGPALAALLQADGINEPRLLGIVKDEAGALKKAIAKGLRDDILLISGGVSMGDYDLVPRILKEAGVREVFHKVNIKPGKPLFFGKKGKTLVFGVPGNPVSTFLAYFIFIRPALYKMSGLGEDLPAFNTGVLTKDFSSSAGRTRFVLVKITERASQRIDTNAKSPLTPLLQRGENETDAESSLYPPLKKGGRGDGQVRDNRYYLTPVNGHGSADVAALSRADGFMMVQSAISFIKRNSAARFITWKTI